MPGATFPPFPHDVPTQPLVIVDYALVKAGDQAEIDVLWKAATEKGFWYMKNHGVEDLLDPMFEMGQETMDLSIQAKMEYWQGNSGGSFGYKAKGATTVDLSGSKDNAEMINVSKDDALAYPRVAHASYPSTVNARMENTVRPFVEACTDANNTIMAVFNAKLGLPEGTLASLHARDEPSVSEARVIKVPATPGSTKIAVGAHTDFGSLSFLANRLGGLQVLLPGQDDWRYVKASGGLARPLPGHVICNVGDALNLFSGGILMSSIHRVLPPPLAQSHFDRWSLVFFTRPGNSVHLKALTELSPLIAQKVAETPDKMHDAGVNAAQWFARRQSKWRVDNQKGLDDYLASRGTEHTQTVV
ncbi:hypothetical protein PLEOSDRAFT_1059225 [Pleurotus ostreatus PC15]|uniref:Fe2OG dioxygenase domain-containing protein n=1 Tax=Pleurotus ostreatus (strain PC15) TaxID=1137138 RepID=A0A067N878_PLEO1|nr:hypothetical protein PLEOSDRAFT_1059225 [Pleurotus ostreatus PC15]